MNETQPLVGVGVMIVKENQVLLGKRKGSHGAGEFAFPGGHLEYMESITDCAKREVREECGIEINQVSFQFVANITEYKPKHYVHIGVLARYVAGEPIVLESDKVESWKWYDINKLPQPLFEPCSMALESYKSGDTFFDT